MSPSQRGVRIARSGGALLVTEGATDPDNYAAVVGRGHETVGRVITAVR